MVARFVYNSFAPRKFEWNFRYVIFKLILVIGGWSVSCEIAVGRLSVDLIDSWQVNIGSSKGLAPSGDKALPVPMSTKF